MNLQVSRNTLFSVGGIFVGTLLLAVILWLHRPAHSIGKTSVSPFENNMMESLVRRVLQEDGVSNSAICFLSFGEERISPSASFIARFADCRQPAVCRVGDSVSPPVNRYFDKSNGSPGTVIQIIKFQKFAPGVFDVTVAISSLPPGHDHMVYRLSDMDGNWVITKHSSS